MNYFIFFLILSLISINNVFAYSYGDPSAAEQAHLEYINRARADPVAEAQRLGLSDVLEGVTDTSTTSNKVPPLTLNENLSLAAKNHTQFMVQIECFAHVCTGEDQVGDRITSSNYIWQTYGENIALTASTLTLDPVEESLTLHNNLFIDKDYPGRGHRVNILSPNFKEVGISLLSGTYQSGFYNAYYITTDFGTQLSDSRYFLLGVVYDDQPATGETTADGFYTAGEGLSGISIDVIETSDTTTTASAGGYAIPLSDGTYTVRFTNQSNQNIERTVTLQGENVKVDITQSEFAGTSQSVPTSAAEVVTNPSEGDSNHTNYFFLEINKTFNNDITVDYATRDGTAIAASDYIATSGTATIEAGKTNTTIAVEIIGDTIAEDTETFDLVLTNPQGANFPTGVTEITASRTIIDDD